MHDFVIRNWAGRSPTASMTCRERGLGERRHRPSTQRNSRCNTIRRWWHEMGHDVIPTPSS